MPALRAPDPRAAAGDAAAGDAAAGDAAAGDAAASTRATVGEAPSDGLLQLLSGDFPTEPENSARWTPRHKHALRSGDRRVRRGGLELGHVQGRDGELTSGRMGALAPLPGVQPQIRR